MRRALIFLLASTFASTFADKAIAAASDQYMGIISKKIQWTPPAKSKAARVVISFTVAKSGVMNNVKIAESSGEADTDALAIAAVKKAMPLPPLPVGMSEFNATFTLPCQRGVTSGGVDLNGYYQDMWRRIQKTWWVPKRLLFCQVELSLSINKDGSLDSLSIKKSSGDKNADRLAVIGVKRAAPFQPLPADVEAPHNFSYSIGFKSDHDKDFSIWNGQRVNTGETYKTSGGSTVGHRDNTTDKDRAFHARKEEALIKMADLDEVIEKEKKAHGADSPALVPLLVKYAAQAKIIEEHVDALNKLKLALSISRKNNVAGHEAELAQTLSALGETEYNLGHLSEAEPLLKEAIELKENVLHSRDQELKNLLETYGRMLYKQNRVQEAEEFYKRAREIKPAD
jgi:TonB family protein